MSDFTITLDGPLSATRLVSLDGVEQLRRASRFSARCILPPGTEPADAAALCGARARLDFAGHLEARRIAGVVERVRVEQRLGSGELSVVLDVRSALARLGHRRTRRIFQACTALGVIEQILEQHGIAHSSHLARRLDRRELCVQYDETDLAFIQRLASEEGMVFFSADPDPGDFSETVFLVDSVAGFYSITGEPTLTQPSGAQAGDGLVQEEHNLRDVHLSERAGTKRVLHRHYDPARPLAPKISAATFDPKRVPSAGVALGEMLPATTEPFGHGEVSLEYRSHSEDETIEATADKSVVLLEALRHKARRVSATTQCVRLGPGRWLKLHHEDEPSFDGEYTVVRASHRYRALSGGPREPRYAVDVELVPRGLVPRGRLIRRTPRESVETAVVVGPSGQEINTEARGRVKVQFHWDMAGRHDDGSSCWIRVAHSWAGSGYGSFFLPRVGMEVLVAFIGGDPDRPVIVGALYNAVNVPPFVQPNEATVSGIVTRAVPGGDGHHELRFDDARGRELVRLRSQKTLELLSTDDTRIGVGGDRATNITGSDDLVVLGDRRERITGGRSVEVQGGSDELTIGSSTTVVMGRRVEHIADRAESIYDRGASISTTGSHTVHVTGDHTLIVGSGDNVAQTSVQGRLALGASGMVTLRSDEGIRLQVGTTTLSLTPDGLEIEAQNIVLKGKSITAEGNGPKLSLGDNAELVSEEVKIYSKKGGIEMSEDTEIWGASLKLQPKKDQPTTDSETGETKTKPFKVRLQDADFEPLAKKHYVLFAEGQRLEGETSGDGGIDVEITAEATVVDVTLYLDDYPTGRTRRYTMNVAELPPETKWPGALTRLHNLGYYGADTDKTEPAATEHDAVKWFQKDHELEPTGELDGATAATIKKVHGS
jgi:type VI secretion system secreted protein VgrG